MFGVVGPNSAPSHFMASKNASMHGSGGRPGRWSPNKAQDTDNNACMNTLEYVGAGA